MKKLLAILCLCLMTDYLHAQGDSSHPGINWQTGLNWEQIKARAKSENKYIFLDVYTTWCVPCKLMDEQVYSDANIGSFVAKNFIAVKVQMDQTSKDDEQVKAWYSDAQYIAKKYRVQGYPTMLFFTPNGVLVHSELGLKKRSEFQRVLRLALDPEKPQMYGMYENYKKGKKLPIQKLGELAMFTKTLVGDDQIAQKMAEQYKTKYLDKLKGEEGFTNETFNLFWSFNNLLTIKDKYFLLCYNHPQRVDSIMKRQGIAMILVNGAIRDQIIVPHAKKRSDSDAIPDWNGIEKEIAEKFKKVDAGTLVLDYEAYYYRTVDPNWILWADAKDEKIRRYPPSLPGTDTFMYVGNNLNDGGAWTVFLNCDDTVVMKRALAWIDLAIKLDPNRSYYYDTKANLLYKLGRRDEALQEEAKAIKLGLAWAKKNNRTPDSWPREAYDKMLKNEPTWPQPKANK